MWISHAKKQTYYFKSCERSLWYVFFSVKLGDQDKSYAPHIVCANCYEILSKWAQPNIRRQRYFLFDWPMSWREQADHENDCYFCCTNTKGKSSSHRKTMLYANVKSVTKTEGIGERKPECKLNEANYLLYWLLFLIM